MNFVNYLLESSQLLLVANRVAISADEELTGGSVKLSVMYGLLPSISTHLTTFSVCENFSFVRGEPGNEANNIVTTHSLFFALKF